MDESMNSAHSISAMDISPACSPLSPISSMPSNHLLLNAFQQHQELLSNILFTDRNINDYRKSIKGRLEEDFDSNQINLAPFPTLVADSANEIQAQNKPDQSNQLRQRKQIEVNTSTFESAPVAFETKSNSFRQLLKILIFISIFISVTYFIFPRTSTSSIQSQASIWQNASEYLTKNIIGQEEGLEAFKDAMEKHTNFTVVIIEGTIGTGKSYLASSLEKFISTTLISVNTLLGLSAHHWTESDRLLSYLLSSLSSSLVQFLIIDDLDLLPRDIKYCQTLATALQSISKHKNIFILLLHTGTSSTMCKDQLENMTTKYIQFNMLQRDHIRRCIQNEAYIQNVQPLFSNEQIEHILNSLQYTTVQGISYSKTGCKQIPSLVMLESKKRST